MELKSVADNGTWTKTPLPPGKITMPCMMMVKRKIDHTRILFCLAPPLVAKGSFQKEYVAYSATFAGVVTIEVLLLSVVRFMSEGAHLQHANVSTAFVNRDIECQLS